MSATSETDAVRAILRLLHENQIAHLIVGSLSVNYYGEPRSTRDVDLVIKADPSDLAPLLQSTTREFECDRQYLFETVTGTTRLVLTHRATRFKVELFLLAEDGFAQCRFERRIPIEFHGVPTFVASKEDVVVQKLRWLARAGRSKDRDDLTKLLAIAGSDLNMEYVHHWTDEHGTTDLLNELLTEVGSPPGGASPMG